MERDPVFGRSVAVAGPGLSPAEPTQVLIALNVIDNRLDFVYRPISIFGGRDRHHPVSSRDHAGEPLRAAATFIEEK